MKELMSKFGYEKITSEIKDLKENERPKIVLAIESALEHGDLKENAEYHSAKEKQAYLDSRIAELSDIISRAEIIDPSKLSHNKISFGSKIKIIDQDTNKEFVYTLVGSTESNIDLNLISYSSPLGKALIGKEVGDEVEFIIGENEKYFNVLEISFEDIIFE